MGAISENFDKLDAAKLAINADVDILLMPVDVTGKEDLQAFRQYIDGIVALVENGKILPSEIDDSVKRILTTKMNRGILDTKSVDADAALKVVGSKAHHDVEWQLALDSVAASKIENKALPTIKNSTKVLIFTPGDSMSKSVDLAYNKLKEQGVISTRKNIKVISYDGITSDISSKYASDIQNADRVILMSKCGQYSDLDTTNANNINAIFLTNVYKQAYAFQKQIVTISCQLPYEAEFYKASDKILFAYNPSTMTEVPTKFDGNTKKYGPNLPAAIYYACF